MLFRSEYNGEFQEAGWKEERGRCWSRGTQAKAREQVLQLGSGAHLSEALKFRQLVAALLPLLLFQGLVRQEAAQAAAHALAHGRQGQHLAPGAATATTDATAPTGSP